MNCRSHSVATSQPSVLFMPCWLISAWVSGCFVEKVESRRFRDEAYNSIRNQVFHFAAHELLPWSSGWGERAEFVGAGAPRWCVPGPSLGSGSCVPQCPNSSHIPLCDTDNFCSCCLPTGSVVFCTISNAYWLRLLLQLLHWSLTSGQFPSLLSGLSGWMTRSHAFLHQLPLKNKKLGIPSLSQTEIYLIPPCAFTRFDWSMLLIPRSTRV